MQITCTPNPDRRSILTIYWDGVPWRDLHTAVFGYKPKLPETQQSPEEFKEYFLNFEYQQAKKYALKRLSIQPMLSTALARAMKERLIFESTIQKVIQECISLGFLNDEEWTASFVRSRSRRNGPRAIAQKLISKGIRGKQLEDALRGEWNIEKQKGLISALLETRYAKRNVTDFKERQKVISSLMRKGFDLSIIMNCFNMKFSLFE